MLSAIVCRGTLSFSHRASVVGTVTACAKRLLSHEIEAQERNLAQEQLFYYWSSIPAQEQEFPCSGAKWELLSQA